ncbi:MAG: hypothetical protein PHG61_09850 [Candidatus Marinimicrobia bacterium]|nr:hypothetical protein [Candidatus Neomarinimicrobiota bacterium]
MPSFKKSDILALYIGDDDKRLGGLVRLAHDVLPEQVIEVRSIKEHEQAGNNLGGDLKGE